MALPNLDLSALNAEVARNTSVDDSAVILIEGFIAAVAAANAVNQAAVEAVLVEFRGSTDRLAASVAANTP